MPQFASYSDVTDLRPLATAVVRNGATGLEQTQELSMATLLDFVERGGRVVEPSDVSPGIAEDGTGDQTDAINAWLAQAGPGVALVATPGAKYRHAGVLDCNAKTRPRIVGYGAEFIAATAATSAFKLRNSTQPRLYGFHHRMETQPTTRGSTEDHHLIYIKDCTDLHVRDTIVQNSHAAGLLMEGVHRFLIERPTAEGGLADGLHMNAGCRQGRVCGATSIGVGDDGVAVVSAVAASGDATLCQDIWVVDSFCHSFPSAVDQGAASGTGGRGLTIVGGRNVHFRRARVVGSWAAGILIGTEPGYTSHSVTNASMRGVIVDSANLGAGGVPHGGILITSDRSGFTVADVLVDAVDVISQINSPMWGGAVRVINGGGAGGTMSNIVIGRAGRPVRVIGAFENTANIQIDPGVAAAVTSNVVKWDGWAPKGDLLRSWATVDFGSAPAQSGGVPGYSANHTRSVPGAEVGAEVVCMLSSLTDAAAQRGVSVVGRVTSAGNVAAWVENRTGAAVDLPSGDLFITVTNPS